MGDEHTGPMGAGSGPTSGLPPSPVPDVTRATAPEVPEARSSPAPGSAAVPGRIGRYTIVRVLGEGGMGTVYEAQQDNPKRTVALKVIRAGYLSAELLRRFGQESQVLGRLQHPGIAQVYEAGTVEERGGEHGLEARATPFFAMEFIKGVPLTEYVNKKGLGTRDRLELVAKVCDAVYHAHQKGVIHRDLKPGNILVDESGQPKILDFGIARATDSDIQQTTLQTDIGQLIGTIPYMSPEQVGGDPNDLDTRSDVYALGVIAYEILAGRLPYDLQRKMIHEAARIIKEEEPTRLSSINRTLKGDVETIVAKALEKDKVRRYQSAESFASDIRRYLKHEPITARPASTWYQAARFARRNRGLVAGIGATFVALIAGLIGTGYGLVRAREQTARAVAARAAESKALEAEREVAAFQASMLADVDATDAGTRLMNDIVERFDATLVKEGVSDADRAARREQLRAHLGKVNPTDTASAMIDRTILTPAVAAVDRKFGDQPLVDASLRQTLSDVYEILGLYEPAEKLQKSALETRRRVLGADHADTLASLNSAGLLQRTRGQLTEAETSLREALDRRRGTGGEDDRETLATIGNLALVIQSQGKLTESEPYFREALDKSRRLMGEDHPDTITAIHNMGGLLRTLGRLSEAEPYFREALEKSRRILGEDHRDTLIVLANTGQLIEGMGRLAEAEPYVRETLEKYRRVFGEEHPNTVSALGGMGVLLVNQGKLAESEPYFREALEKSRRSLGEDHMVTFSSLGCLGYVLQHQGKLDEAEPLLRETLEKFRRVLGQEHPDTLIAIGNLGHLLMSMGMHDEAGELFSEQLEKSRRILVGEANPGLLSAIDNVVYARMAQGRLDEAESLLAPAAEIADKQLPPDHQFRKVLVTRMAMLYEARDKAEPGKGHDAKAAQWRAKLEAPPSAPAGRSPDPGK